MNISPLDIKQKQFRLKFRGFDIAEVDAFLDEVTSEMEALLREVESLKEDKAALEGRLVEYHETEKALRDTLMAAQKMSEDMRSSTEKECQLKLREAEMEAEKMLADARRELAKAQEEIDELARIKERFALKVKGVIEDHLKMLAYEERQERKERQEEK